MNTIDLRIENTKKNIQDLEKKVERIKVALETGKNPYYYDERTLKWALKDLEDAKQKLIQYEEKKRINESIEKVPIIEEFLEKWKIRVVEWHKRDFQRLKDYLKERKQKTEEFEKWKVEQFKYTWMDNEETKAKEKEMGIDWETYKKDLKSKFSPFTVELHSFGKDWENRLDTVIEREKNDKRKLFLERVKEITGAIKDAGGLSIGGNGEINGYVVGEKGKARVETISAGGWNIQCFHYRVLVREF